jgi:Zn-dependent protease with chaperone function
MKPPSERACLAQLLPLLLEGYYRFLALLTGVVALGVVGLLALFARAPFWGWLVLAAALGLPWVQFVLSCRWLIGLRPPDHGLRLPYELLQPLYRFVAGLAREQRLPMPDEIRLASDTVAAALEDEAGRDVLLIGGIAVAALAQPALAGIIAHELAHFAGGDTRVSRRAWRRELTMGLLEAHLAEQPWGFLNPLTWAVHGYHALYRLAYFADSRRMEYAADRETVALVGKKTAAAALIHIYVLERLPGARLDHVLQSFVETNQPLDRAFAEQVRRLRATDDHDWESSCRRCLAKRTGAFDSHPSLRDRLKAIGASPRNAVTWARHQALDGPPAAELIPGWPAIEKVFTGQLVAAAREVFLHKREMAQILLGRPLDR